MTFNDFENENKNKIKVVFRFKLSFSMEINEYMQEKWLRKEMELNQRLEDM
jgi:hypothetical protein